LVGLLTYEYANTFGREVDFFWKRRPTGASVLFFFNRYLPLVVNAVSFIGLASLSAKVRTCHCLTTFSALRVFALSSRSWPLAILVFLLATMPFAINCYTYTFLASINDPIFGCEATRYISLALTKGLVIPTLFSFTIASRTCLMASDVLVIITTWVATRNAIRLHGEGRPIRNSFAGTLLRDGTIYFIVLLIMNALHLTFTMLPIVDASLAPVSYLTLFTEPITAVLVSRFMLNLQAVNKRAMHGDTELETLTHQIGPVNFERVVGSLGSDVLPSLSTHTSDSFSEREEPEGSVRDYDMGATTEEGHPSLNGESSRPGT
ncbi:hypothetical protein C8T65DRAFT_579800, partial [Cerioporus squamosus]